MDSRVIIKVADKNELNRIYKFHEIYYPGQRSKEDWEWEYGEKSMKDSVLVLAKSGDNFVATVGMMTVPINIGGKKLLSGKNESLLIDNDFRGKGVCTGIYNYGISKCDEKKMVCIWGFTKKAIGPLKRVNFKIFNKSIKVAILPLNYRTTTAIAKVSGKTNIKATLLRGIIKLASLYSNVIFYSRIFLTGKHGKNIEITDVLKSKDDILQMYKNLRIKNSDLIHIHMDDSFIDWRIHNSPNKTLSFFAYEAGNLEGNLFITIRDNNVELTDFTFNKKTAGIFLIKKLIEVIEKNNIGFISYYGNINNALNKRIFRLLMTFGFFLIKGPNEFVLRKADSFENRHFLDIRKWYINGLWLEGI